LHGQEIRIAPKSKSLSVPPGRVAMGIGTGC
jgi:hypothetical protein